ncbi:MAG: divalent-cation tolerance protein CutA [Elusimicrobia bacterium]|jgi:periplasmic divalent cation tolerance protein|nr:divalent-cation tolerance protein CutA [Elusimicrobiota bacterium]
MPDASQFRILLVTAPDAKVADVLASGLVERKLAACISIVPGITSIYRWEGSLHKDSEALLIIKTRVGALYELSQFIKENHPAKVPEIISLPILEGNAAYLEWLGANVIFTRKAEEAQFPF